MSDYKQELIRDTLMDLPKVVCVSGREGMDEKCVFNINLDFFSLKGRDRAHKNHFVWFFT